MGVWLRSENTHRSNRSNLVVGSWGFAFRVSEVPFILLYIPHLRFSFLVSYFLFLQSFLPSQLQDIVIHRNDFPRSVLSSSFRLSPYPLRSNLGPDLFSLTD